ncbi:DUF4345 domain-containing protein [Rhizobium sp. EC-SD404]|uniref:DUF4345 domain-containing protein n=1 Tax=Rhizobium sp. EC-SD404 TaxID=2038389 RepID=UPI00125A910F|nr:DUF4345 domain-containing protein [Rhizobium sp. EC-SD404]VVT03676.1 conserved membrane hypothetical protein [Rhizobium sp. EC-SD404]
MNERRLLQVVVAVLSLMPVCAGLAGVVLGPGFLSTEEPWSASLDSHVRFLSGVFFALGLAWWSCVPNIERKTDRMRLLGVATIVGGLARLGSLVVVGVPSAGHLVGLGLELVIVPLILVWQTRIRRIALSGEGRT